MDAKTLNGVLVAAIVSILGAAGGLLFEMKSAVDVQTVKLEQEQSQSKMLWKYTTFEHDQINLLRSKAGMEPVGSPEFNP